jgi:hypothetical protein
MRILHTDGTHILTGMHVRNQAGTGKEIFYPNDLITPTEFELAMFPNKFNLVETPEPINGGTVDGGVVNDIDNGAENGGGRVDQPAAENPLGTVEETPAPETTPEEVVAEITPATEATVEAPAALSGGGVNFEQLATAKEKIQAIIDNAETYSEDVVKAAKKFKTRNPEKQSSVDALAAEIEAWHAQVHADMLAEVEALSGQV